MMVRWSLCLAAIVLVALISFTAIQASARPGPPQAPVPAGEDGPVTSRDASGAPDASSAPDQADDAIVVDHRHIDLSHIPEPWLAEARALTLHYGHTSHGSQIMSGIDRLARGNPSVAIAVKRGGPVGLPEADDALRIYDGNNPDTYITPELYWSAAGGIAKTQSVAATGLFGLSMWSWCGQQSSNSEDTVQQYLDQLDQFETEFPDMRFIYMTGHTDGGRDTLRRNNDMVRDYVAANGKVLFDFADIESYDPDGKHYPDTTDACPWCQPWCDDNPEYCSDLPGSCAHSHPLNCKMKGQAFWWMMARLAGWPGPDAPPETPVPTATDSPPAPTGTPTLPPEATPTDQPAPPTATDAPPPGEFVLCVPVAER